MKVLHLIPSMGGGGAERQLTYLCKELVKIGCTVYVALLYGGPNLERLERSGAQVIRLKCRSNYDPTLILLIAQLIRRLKPDILQTWLPQMDVLGGLASLCADTKHILSERCNADLYQGGWKDQLRLFWGKRATLIVANSSGGRDYWRSMGVSSDKLVIVRNAIPIDDIEDDATKVILNTDSIVFAGRYDHQKNLFVMMEALKIVLEQQPSVTAYLYGEGPLISALYDFRDRHNLVDQIQIGGYVDPIWSVLKHASVFISLSLFEGTPNIVLEAVASGCPVVVSDIPAHREFLDNDSALFVPYDSPHMAAESILKSLTERQAALSRAMHARSNIACWSPALIAAEYLDLYQKLVH